MGSAATLLLYAGYVLIGGALLAPSLATVRILIAGAALLWMGAALLHHELGIAAMSGALLVLALVMIGRRLWENQSVHFTAEEQAMVGTLFNELPRSRARHLIDQGVWLNGADGDVLTREGEAVGHLYYLAEGEARVLMGGVEVGLCRRGDLIGELTVLSDETASATVVLRGPARFWCALAGDLRPYVEAHEDIRRAIEHGFATVLKAKLRASNRTIAEAAGARA